MNRRHTIIVLTCAFYALQIGLLVYWHSLAASDMRAIDAFISLAIALILGVIDASVARYLLQALHRSETVYATDVSTRLERSLEGYRLAAERDEELMREVGYAVERELASAREALSQRRAADADNHIRASVDIASQTKPSYCDNVAIAAVLDSKARQCDEAGVGFDAKVDLPADLPLQDIEVAAIFFNLIDNALHEGEALLEESEEAVPTVTVRSKVQAGQLFIEVSNPFRTESGTIRNVRRNALTLRSESADEHGWGTSIVTTIARDHGGIAEFETHGKTFVATVMLPLPESSQS